MLKRDTNEGQGALTSSVFRAQCLVVLLEPGQCRTGRGALSGGFACSLDEIALGQSSACDFRIFPDCSYGSPGLNLHLTAKAAWAASGDSDHP
jgi:hypothetical protein